MERMTTSNHWLIHNTLWNSCAGGNGSGCPRAIEEHLLDLYLKQHSDELWHPLRMDAEDVAKLEALINIASDIAAQTEKLEDMIGQLAAKYKAKAQGKTEQSE